MTAVLSAKVGIVVPEATKFGSGLASKVGNLPKYMQKKAIIGQNGSEKVQKSQAGSEKVQKSQTGTVQVQKGRYRSLEKVGNATPDTTKFGSDLDTKVGNATPVTAKILTDSMPKVGNLPKYMQKKVGPNQNRSEKVGPNNSETILQLFNRAIAAILSTWRPAAKWISARCFRADQNRSEKVTPGQKRWGMLLRKQPKYSKIGSQKWGMLLRTQPNLEANLPMKWGIGPYTIKNIIMDAQININGKRIATKRMSSALAVESTPIKYHI